MKFSALIAILVVATVATAMPTSDSTHALEKHSCRSTTLSWNVYLGPYAGSFRNKFTLEVNSYYHGSFGFVDRPDAAVDRCDDQPVELTAPDALTLIYKGREHPKSKRDHTGPTPSNGVDGAYEYWDCVEV
ncbi:hypothetical protein EC957_005557 [Mortierella hygrophila]|uniref:AA1-like domain-containing protein n=1 Tax=Mortierella hygrophila TaxID=979708 RepID=A0A9P6F0Q7_9FUNG|nr:hypothetical protein EC957_005557 [Mortierella hygrophila]